MTKSIKELFDEIVPEIKVFKWLWDEHLHNSLPLCVTDAIYSISLRYEPCVKPVVAGFRAYLESKNVPITSVEWALQVVHNEMSSGGGAINAFIGKRYRTSSTNGIFKAEAVYFWLKILSDYKIRSLEDFKRVMSSWSIESKNLEKDLRSVPGQRSGISLRYLRMLAGDTTEFKPDRMIYRFFFGNGGTVMSESERISIEKQLPELLKMAISSWLLDKKHTGDIRVIDNIIWKYQSKKS